MRIPPVAKLLIQTQIFTAYIESTDKSDPSVYDYDLSVVSVIHTKLQLSKQRREKLCDLYTARLQPVPVFFMHCSAAHTVK